jgi:hypothetical protein
MTIENGTAIVLAYVLVSMGVIIAFLLAAFNHFDESSELIEIEAAH